MLRSLRWLLPLAVFFPVHSAAARPRITPPPPGASWCDEQTETLPDDICYFDGIPAPKDDAKAQRRTLVVFLHGVVPPDSTWQWTQHKALVRDAKKLGFAVLMPRAPRRSYGRAGDLYSWPTAISAQRVEEEGLVTSWARAQKFIEAREGRPFDDVFIIGFSSGAYYASSLAQRGRLDVDGYALMAGGAAGRAPGTQSRKPIYVGVSARDKQTAPDARGLASALSAWHWPHEVQEEPVGHMVADVHMAHALTYLRKQTHHGHAIIVPTGKDAEESAQLP